MKDIFHLKQMNYKKTKENYMFGLRLDKRTIIIIIAVVAALWIVRSGGDGILDLLYTLPGILIALTFHEFAHAFAADKLRR